MTVVEMARTTGVAVLAGLLFLVPARAHAQGDFLFDRPSVTLSLFGGWWMPAEGSDVFDETRQELTIEEGDFQSVMGLAELAVRVTERIDGTLSISRASQTVDSEMRGWEWADGDPIRQSTKFARTSVLVGGKFYLLPRGREISRFAWVPARWSPYVGAGAGVTGYEFAQVGDFAVQLGDDPLDRDILELRVESSGSGFAAEALGGVQLSLSPRFLLRGEYRYLWGSSDLDAESFEGFDPIDVSGSQLLLGVSLRM